MAIVGYWGEGSGAHLLRDETRKALLSAYLDGFESTPLIFQPLERRRAGSRLPRPGPADRRPLARWHRQRYRPQDASPRLALRLPGRPGLLEGPGPRLVPHDRRVSPAADRERDGRRVAQGSRLAGDLRHLPQLARQAGLRREGGTVHLRSGAQVAHLVVQCQELAGPPGVDAPRGGLAEEDGLPARASQADLPGPGPAARRPAVHELVGEQGRGSVLPGLPARLPAGRTGATRRFSSPTPTSRPGCRATPSTTIESSCPRPCPRESTSSSSASSTGRPASPGCAWPSRAGTTRAGIRWARSRWRTAPTGSGSTATSIPPSC